MSNRVIRKLYGEDELKKLAENLKSDDSSDDDVISGKNSKKNKNKSTNRFDLLSNLNSSNSETETKEDDEGKNEATKFNNKDKILSQKQSNVNSLERKKKRKKKLKQQKSNEKDADLELIDQFCKEFSIHDQVQKKEFKEPKAKKNLLTVESRYLKAENELKRIFGAKVVAADLQRKGYKNRLNPPRSWILVNPNTLSEAKPSFTMEHVRSDEYHHFNFVHSKSYQLIQFRFLDAAESSNPGNLIDLLTLHPYHVDTLIQASELCKMTGEDQMAAELIERALHCFEVSFHPLFNVTQANCRLDYRRPENRSFFIALFKHIQYTSNKGCNRTALEFCKLLLGLDPEGDPLCALCMIDFYAIKAEQYEYLRKFRIEWDDIRLELLPNIAYSFSLACFLEGNQKKDDELQGKANTILQETLLTFPNMLIPLLKKCCVEPDKEVYKCKFFTDLKVPTALQDLCSIYVARSYTLWKDRKIIKWLEDNVHNVMKKVGIKEEENCIERWNKYFNTNTPKNVLRHILLSDIKVEGARLPSRLNGQTIFLYDPLPPADNIISYSRPQTDLHNSGRSVLTELFSSLLPHFTPEESGALVNQIIYENENTIENTLGRSVVSLLDAMRSLLNSINSTDTTDQGDIESGA